MKTVSPNHSKRNDSFIGKLTLQCFPDSDYSASNRSIMWLPWWLSWSSFDDWLLCCRYVCCFSTGKSDVSPFPVLGPVFLKGFLSQPRFFRSFCQSAPAHCDPQFREELWFHHSSYPGVCGRQRHLHSASHRLGKAVFLASFHSQQTRE